MAQKSIDYFATLDLKFKLIENFSASMRASNEVGKPFSYPILGILISCFFGDESIIMVNRKIIGRS